MKNFLTTYEKYTKLAFDNSIHQTIEEFRSLALEVKTPDAKLIFAGNGASAAKDLGLRVVTFTGRNIKNSLKSYGDINFWVNSDADNILECIHMILAITVIDAIVGSSVYEVS
jgi:phosphoheptose isomerase